MMLYALLFTGVLTNLPDKAPTNILPRPDNLRGEWLLLETVDEKRTDRGDDQIRMVVSGNQVTLAFHGKATNEGKFELGERDGSTIIDMKFRNGLALVGILKLEGDTLTVCFDKATRPRPSGLLPTGSQWQEKWKRVMP